MTIGTRAVTAPVEGASFKLSLQIIDERQAVCATTLQVLIGGKAVYLRSISNRASIR